MHPFKPDPNDPLKVTRNIVLTCLGALFSITIILLLLIKTGDSNTAAMLTAASGIIIVIIPVLAAPILYYFNLGNKPPKLDIPD